MIESRTIVIRFSCVSYWWYVAIYLYDDIALCRPTGQRWWSEALSCIFNIRCKMDCWYRHCWTGHSRCDCFGRERVNAGVRWLYKTYSTYASFCLWFTLETGYGLCAQPRRQQWQTTSDWKDESHAVTRLISIHEYRYKHTIDFMIYWRSTELWIVGRDMYPESNVIDLFTRIEHVSNKSNNG